MNAASDKLAADIVLLDMRGVCSFTDYFVICNGNTDHHIKAIRDAIRDMLRKENLPTGRTEGHGESGWVLLDCGNIIIHIFTPQEREYYQLDKLWDKAQLVVRMQ